MSPVVSSTIAGSEPDLVKGPTIELLRRKKDEILAIFERHGCFDVRVFGSVVRGEATAESDNAAQLTEALS